MARCPLFTASPRSQTPHPQKPRRPEQHDPDRGLQRAPREPVCDARAEHRADSLHRAERQADLQLGRSGKPETQSCKQRQRDLNRLTCADCAQHREPPERQSGEQEHRPARPGQRRAETDPAAEEVAQLQAAVERGLSESLAGDIFEAYARTLQQTHGLRLNPQVAAAVNATIQ